MIVDSNHVQGKPAVKRGHTTARNISEMPYSIALSPVLRIDEYDF